MIDQRLKETIADYGFETTLMAMLRLIQEGYLIPSYEMVVMATFRNILECALTEFQCRQGSYIIVDGQFANWQNDTGE